MVNSVHPTQPVLLKNVDVLNKSLLTSVIMEAPRHSISTAIQVAVNNNQIPIRQLAAVENLVNVDMQTTVTLTGRLKVIYIQ